MLLRVPYLIGGLTYNSIVLCLHNLAFLFLISEAI